MAKFFKKNWKMGHNRAWNKPYIIIFNKKINYACKNDQIRLKSYYGCCNSHVRYKKIDFRKISYFQPYSKPWIPLRSRLVINFDRFLTKTYSYYRYYWYFWASTFVVVAELVDVFSAWSIWSEACFRFQFMVNDCDEFYIT